MANVARKMKEEVEAVTVAQATPEVIQAPAIETPVVANEERVERRANIIDFDNLTDEQLLALKKQAEERLNKKDLMRIEELKARQEELTKEFTLNQHEMNVLILKTGGEVLKANKLPKEVKEVRPAKYRFGEATWHGKGKHPDWLVAEFTRLGCQDDKEKQREWLKEHLIAE
jgi:DNA-binding protein H-NS